MTVTTGCNEKSSATSEEYASDSSMTAVTGFSLKAKNSVCANLDSVFFSIDLDKRVIFNADSLPMGTKVSSLVPVITYPTNAKAVTIAQTGASTEDKTVDYLSNPSDSIDFTGKVVLTITAADGESSRSYNIKVNVHTINPDSLVWTNSVTATLPSRLTNPRNQRTVEFDDKILSFIEESDGSFTLSTTSAFESKNWNKKAVTLTFTPRVRTLTAAADALYILDSAGKLYTSSDGESWTDTGVVWTQIIGGYDSLLLGLRENGGKLVHTSYPASVRETEVDNSFPISGFSNMLCFGNSWSPATTAIIAGGRKADGSLCNVAWGFDGNDWAALTAVGNAFEGVEDATLVPYFMYRKSSWLWYQSEHAALMLIGGRNAAGVPTKNVYYTINNGIIWTAASEEAAMPLTMPAAAGLDGLVLSTPMSGSLTDAWAERPARLNYQVNNYEVSWDCPYIYLFGGVGTDGKLIPTIRRGVLARLEFMPMI